MVPAGQPDQAERRQIEHAGDIDAVDDDEQPNKKEDCYPIHLVECLDDPNGLLFALPMMFDIVQQQLRAVNFNRVLPKDRSNQGSKVRIHLPPG